ncbi:hypothetical protein OUZ56_011872 [Daphnia magna]|uniref:Uncharacterized protein n=1 Tax=Daphnia magna TaxID=35525 RepID=A0ABQ9Z1L3_9CRUS|nr:hypothetical protein OUZ56_011872 [Daphnia magna]
MKSINQYENIDHNNTICVDQFQDAVQHVQQDDGQHVHQRTGQHVHQDAASIAAAEFVMSMLGQNKCTQVQLQSVMSGTNDLMRQVVNQTLDSVNHLLADSGCDHSMLIEELKLRNSSAVSIFHKFRDQYNQIKYFKKHYGLIMPIKVKLPPLRENFGRVKVMEDQKFFTEEYVVVPLIDQIEQLLNIKEIYDVINTPPNIRKGLLTSYSDGTKFKESQLFKRHPNALLRVPTVRN